MCDSILAALGETPEGPKHSLQTLTHHLVTIIFGDIKLLPANDLGHLRDLLWSEMK